MAANDEQRALRARLSAADAVLEGDVLVALAQFMRHGGTPEQVRRRACRPLVPLLLPPLLRHASPQSASCLRSTRPRSPLSPSGSARPRPAGGRTRSVRLTLCGTRTGGRG